MSSKSTNGSCVWKDKVEESKVNAAFMAERVNTLEWKRGNLSADVANLLSQSMCNNLVFTGI